VSHQIKLPEQELGVCLFTRSSTGLRMTEAGHILLPWARRLLHNMDEIEDMMASLQEVAVGELHMMYGTATGNYILPQLATRFCLLYLKIKVRILASNPHTIVLNLLDGAAHPGIVSTQVNDQKLESQEFYRDTIGLIVPANHPWASRASIEPADIVQEPLFIREETSGTRWAMLSELSKFDISLEDLNVFMEIGNAEGIVETIS
jgi:DNA-binding transcriptional LysR family regulator